MAAVSGAKPGEDRAFGAVWRGFGDHYRDVRHQMAVTSYYSFICMNATRRRPGGLVYRCFNPENENFLLFLVPADQGIHMQGT
jgi:hypothetical protein